MSEYTISCWSCRGSGVHYATGEDCHLCLHPSGLFSTGRVTVVPVSEKAKWQAEALREAASGIRGWEDAQWIRARLRARAYHIEKGSDDDRL